MLLYHRPVPAKAPKRRSRAGCIHCKEKKKKCNEERPQCDRCMERGLKCQYEPVKPRKSRKTTTAVDEEERPRGVTSDPGPHGLSHALSHPGYPHSLPAGIPSETRTALMDFRPNSTSSSVYDDPWDEDPASDFQSPISSVHDLSPAESGDGLPPLTDIKGGPPCGPLGISTPHAMPEYALHSTVVSPIATGYPRSPIPRNMVPPGSTVVTTNGRPELSLTTPVSNPSPREFPPSPYVNLLSRYVEYSPRPNRQALVDHFCRVLAHLLVFTDHPGNPLQQHILPMGLRSAPVMNAIFALSAAHMEHRGLRNEERSLDFHSQALQGLAQLIADSNASRDETMSVIILLIYYEIVRNGSPAACSSHLRGALSIMRARGPHRGPTSSFLERAFRYFDVICALSFSIPPMSGSVIVPPHEDMFPTGQEPTMMSSVDAVFGFVGDLWPLMHRLTHLNELRKALDTQAPHSPGHPANMQAELESSCASLELALHQWTPKLAGSHQASTPSEGPSIEDSRVQSMLNHAEAYRQAATVYLNRTVQRNRRKAGRIQTPVKQGLQACLRVVVFGGPMTAVLWPLFTLAAEAVDDVDRNVARTVFRYLESRQGMANIVQGWEVVEDIWRRQDMGEEVEWSR
ncbi:MAG: hypothetical protein M1816_002881, partial [Peltula sp. TS41687]